MGLVFRAIQGGKCEFLFFKNVLAFQAIECQSKE